MSNYTTFYIGMDVHKMSVTLTAISADGNTLHSVKLPHDYKKIRRHLDRFVREYSAAQLHICYEAGVCGFALHREMARWGYSCEIVAPSLVPKRPGERRKTDRRDAETLARMYRAGELSFVRVPDEQDESVRDLLRYREVLRKEILMSRHYVLKFLLRKGFHFSEGVHWTRAHWTWLRSIRFDSAMDQLVFQEYLTLLEFKLQRREEVDRQLQDLAEHPRYVEGVKLLRAYRGIDTLSALVLLVEIGDFQRFSKARELMAFLGLVPSEHSSGDKQRHGSITKTGNSHCRHILVQAAWHYLRTCRTEHMKSQLVGLPAWVAASAVEAQRRLFRKYWKLARRKSSQIAVVAVARELAGFLWATMCRWQQQKHTFSFVDQVA